MSQDTKNHWIDPVAGRKWMDELRELNHLRESVMGGYAAMSLEARADYDAMKESLRSRLPADYFMHRVLVG